MRVENAKKLRFEIFDEIWKFPAAETVRESPQGASFRPPPPLKEGKWESGSVEIPCKKRAKEKCTDGKKKKKRENEGSRRNAST